MNLKDKLFAMDRNLIFSGQLFFRERGSSIHLDMTDRILHAVAGIVAVPKTIELPGEHQYGVAGMVSPAEGLIIGLDPKGKDITKQAEGHTIGQLLTEPIWRI